MDILTHGLLGGTLAQSCSHVGALLVSLILWPAFKKLWDPLGFRRIYLYAFLGCATSGALDACTSYGTHLLWPFAGERIAWSIVPIFDPLFSLILGTAMLAGLRWRKTLLARIGLLLAAAYLSVGWLQHQRTEDTIRATALLRGHQTERLTVKPTMGNLLLWRSIYRSGGIYYIDAVRVGIGGSGRIYPGNTVRAFDPLRDLPTLSTASILHHDIRRFDLFSNGYLALHPEDPGLLGDVRYAMLPTSTRPLWGIRLDLQHTETHAAFETSRRMPRQEIDQFVKMLRGIY